MIVDAKSHCGVQFLPLQVVPEQQKSAGITQKNRQLEELLKIRGVPGDWRDRIKAGLASQLAAGDTLQGIRSHGAQIARTLYKKPT